MSQRITEQLKIKKNAVEYGLTAEIIKYIRDKSTAQLLDFFNNISKEMIIFPEWNNEIIL